MKKTVKPDIVHTIKAPTPLKTSKSGRELRSKNAPKEEDAPTQPTGPTVLETWCPEVLLNT